MAISLLLLLDDVAALTKVAARKTAGGLGDDLALNAKQVAGVDPACELSVVLRVAHGSAFNKLILVPAALAISWLAAWAIAPLLIAGGAFLCYEGAEKILHRRMQSETGGHRGGATGARGRETSDIGPSASAGAVGVYGLVAAIVKLDDAGTLLAARPERWLAACGRGILAVAPWLMRGLSVAGTAAMFLVGGGIIAHGVPVIHDALHELSAALATGARAAVGLGVGLVLVGVAAAGRIAGTRSVRG